MKSFKTAGLNLFASILFIAVMAMFISSLTGTSYLCWFAGLVLLSVCIKNPHGSLLETVVKPLSEQLSDMRTSLESQLSTKAQAEVKAQLKEFEDNIKALENKVDKTELKSLQDSLEEMKKLVEEFKGWKVTKDESDKKNQEFIDKMAAERKRKPMGGAAAETKSFNDIIGETIERNAEAIKSHRPFLSGTGERTTFFPLYNEEEMKSFEKNKEGKPEVKAVGDMSISANFSGATALYQDVRQPMIETPVNKVYLADLIPNGTSGGSQVVYPKENGTGEGGVASWTDYSTNKAQVDFDLTSSTTPFVWGAGFVIVQRDMLDDIPFMTNYIQNRLLLSLKTWENGFIINGGGAVQGLSALATAYNGALTIPVEQLIDAAYGQIVDDTKEFYTGNLAIVRSRDLVTKIALNKAQGSGEYNFPPGSIVLSPDGTVRIGNLTTVGTTQVNALDFYALDRNATIFIRRIQPELRLFEDATLAKKNQLMWRIEERATFIVFNDAAVVKGTLDSGS
jgi:HK97 family phage major capsid protein